MDKNWTMADVSAKAVTRRVAVAGGRIHVGPEALGKIEARQLAKGDPLAMAEISGTLAAKQTPSLIPLCHPISLDRVIVRSVLRPEEGAVDVFCAASISEKTGVEMEALTGLSIALLTIWDLVKPVNPAQEVSDVKLLFKSGGKRGDWMHPEGMPPEVRTVLAEMGIELEES
ncbi:MAG: cyclic pyranopterin monophosphate synthase MoaC [Lysobacterales bacterium]